MIKNLFIIVLLAVILLLLYRHNTPKEQPKPKAEISVKIRQNEIKVETPKPTFKTIKFKQVKVGEKFIYKDMEYKKTSNQTYYQPLYQPPPINPSLPFQHQQHLSFPINNAKDQYGREFHFEWTEEVRQYD